MNRAPSQTYIRVPAKGSLPSPSSAFKDQLCIVRGAPGLEDELYICRYTGSTYEWIELTEVITGTANQIVVTNGAGATTVALANPLIFPGDVSAGGWTIDGPTGDFQTDGTIDVGQASTLRGAVAITETTGEAIRVQKENDGPVVWSVDTNVDRMQTVNGADLVGWSDAYITEKWRIHGATGNIETDGGLTLGGFFDLANFFVIASEIQATADIATNADTVNNVTAIDTDIILPTGTWTIYAAGFVNLRNTSDLTVDAKLSVDGTDSVIIGRTYPSSGASSPQVLFGTKAGVVGGGTKVVQVRYKAGTGGTAEAFACGILALAIRTA